MREVLLPAAVCALLMASCCHAQSCTIALCGDADLSGRVDIVDGLKTAQAAAGLVILSTQAFSAANVYGALEPDPGAMIGAVDSLTIARFVTGFDVLTCCTPFNTPPTCAITAPMGGAFVDDVTVDFTATDTDGDPLSLTFEYSRDGGVTWMTATATGTSPLPSPAAGIPPGPLTFVWDSIADEPLSGGMGPPLPLTADILTVNDYAGGLQHYSNAVTALGYTETLITNSPPGQIAAQLTGAGPWDMVIVNCRTGGTPNATDRAELVNYVTGGGLLIFHTWNVWLWPADPLLALMEVNYVSDYTIPPDMFIWDLAHPTTIFPNVVGDLPVNLLLDAWNRDGQRVDALGGAEAVVGYAPGPGVTPGEGAIIVNSTCTTHFQGAAVDCYDGDLDLDGRADIEELAENEIVALFTGCIPTNRPVVVIFRVTVDDGMAANTCVSLPFDLVDPLPCTYMIYGDLTGFGVRTDSGSTAGRTDESNPGCGPPGSAGEALYTFTPPLSGVYTIDTIGSSYNTVLSLRTDCDDPATEIACDDNSGGGGTSLMMPVLVTGTEYYIAVDGSGSAEGAYTITIRPPPPASCTVEEVLPGLVPITRIGNISGADETYAPSCAGGGGLDHVYEFTPAASGNYDISLCGPATNYDTVLGLWDNDCFTGVELVCNNDACGTASEILNYPLVAGTTYYILVDGFLGLEGDYQLDIGLTPPPCTFSPGLPSCGGTVEATLAGVLPIVVNGDTTGADDTVLGPCAIGGADHVFQFAADITNTYTFTLCGGVTAFDSSIHIRRGDCQAGPILACNDDSCGLQSEVTVMLFGGTGTYYVIVDGATPLDFGAYELTITCP